MIAVLSRHHGGTVSDVPGKYRTKEGCHEAPVKMWDAFQWSSAQQMRHLRTFAFSIGKRYQELVPNSDLVSPNKSGVLVSYEGWAYCARTPDKEIFLLHFEKGGPRSQLRGAKLLANYRAQWFDPRNGDWQDAGSGSLRASPSGPSACRRVPATTTGE